MIRRLRRNALNTSPNSDVTITATKCARTLLAPLAALRVGALTDEALVQRAFAWFWAHLSTRDDVSNAAKLLAHEQIVDAREQLRRPQEAWDARKRLRAYVCWAMLRNAEVRLLARLSGSGRS